MSTGRPENGARMQLELVLPLRDHGHHAGVVRARADFAEPDLVALDEKLDAEDALAAEVVGHLPGDLLGALQGERLHRMRLPALDIVAMHLQMADRCAEPGFDLTVALRARTVSSVIS